jgi:hypothetical protein
MLCDLFAQVKELVQRIAGGNDEEVVLVLDFGASMVKMGTPPHRRVWKLTYQIISHGWTHSG